MWRLAAAALVAAAPVAALTPAKPAVPAPVKAATAAVNWTVDPAASRIGFTATWLGKPLEGVFKRWGAAINFDPANPAAAVVKVDIDLASAATGDRTADGALPEADWFAVKSSPTARFASTSISRVGKTGNNWLAKGTLTMRGRAVPVDLPFTLTIAGTTATMQGSARIDRRSWAIGADSDATAEYIAFAVPLRINVVARRAK